MEEQEQKVQSEDVEAHHIHKAGLVEEPGTPDEQGMRRRTEDDDVEAHHIHKAGLQEEPESDGHERAS